METKKTILSVLAGSVTGIMTGIYLSQREKDNANKKNSASLKVRKNSSSSDEFHYFI